MDREYTKDQASDINQRVEEFNKEMETLLNKYEVSVVLNPAQLAIIDTKYAKNKGENVIKSILEE